MVLEQWGPFREIRRMEHRMNRAWRFKRTGARWIVKGMSLRSALNYVIPYKYVLDGDRLRIMSQEEALTYWRTWWSEERKKQSKK